MRVNLITDSYAIKVSDFTCLTNVLAQVTAGTGTAVRIGRNKSDLEQGQVGSNPSIGLVLATGNIYSFCWKGDFYAIPVGGTMFLDIEPMTE